MGYMDVIHDDTVREFIEECGLQQSGVRFPQEKRQRIEESPCAAGTRNYEKRPEGTKRP